mmetsp:Transcript_3199/g.5503  ORF Transcript_3199/g.5503 Transcript_3199/m.5503 type:complete len:160 (-) Transcript_3199:133-612(-)
MVVIQSESSESNCPRPLDVKLLEDCLNKPCVCMTFNCALAMHAMALEIPQEQDDARRERTFASAARLYKVSRTLRDGHNVQMEPLYSLAVCNNLGRCYQVLGAENRANDCFQTLLKYLVLIQQQRHYRFVENMARITSCECFHHNTASLILKSLVASAA